MVGEGGLVMKGLGFGLGEVADWLLIGIELKKCELKFLVENLMTKF